jgi:hypothetical protein
MRGRLRVAWLLLALFALQAGATAVASAAGPDCCPAMAAAGPETPSPCRTLSAVGCCEERSGAATPDVSAPPGPALLAPGCPATAGAELPARASSATAGEPVARALRTTILRL